MYLKTAKVMKVQKTTENTNNYLNNWYKAYLYILVWILFSINTSIVLYWQKQTVILQNELRIQDCLQKSCCCGTWLFCEFAVHNNCWTNLSGHMRFYCLHICQQLYLLCRLLSSRKSEISFSRLFGFFCKSALIERKSAMRGSSLAESIKKV